MRVAVVGARGFVGGATVEALIQRAVDVRPVRAPRLAPVHAQVATLDGLPQVVSDHRDVVSDLAAELQGCGAVVNAAGDPDASSRDGGRLHAANAVLPVLIARAADEAGVPRLVHVSSAVVQGRQPILDDSSTLAPFSAYSLSKARAEEMLAGLERPDIVVYRPPSVHSADRRVTRSLSAIARSPLSSVAAPGTDPSPQAHIENVADAIAYLAVCPQRPAAVVAHPWEGLTTAGLLRLLGDRDPVRVPRPLASAVVTTLGALGRRVTAMAAHARRVEMVWFGQAQAESWLERSDWSPPAGDQSWRRIAQDTRSSSIGEIT